MEACVANYREHYIYSLLPDSSHQVLLEACLLTIGSTIYIYIYSLLPDSSHQVLLEACVANYREHYIYSLLPDSSYQVLLEACVANAIVTRAVLSVIQLITSLLRKRRAAYQ